MNILTNYKVKFLIRNLHGKEWESIESVNMWLSTYITYYRSTYRVNKLLDSIDRVLDGIVPEAGGATQADNYCSIKKAGTKIYWNADEWFDNPDKQPDFELPTSDFKVIVEAWRDYLMSRGK